MIQAKEVAKRIMEELRKLRRYSSGLDRPCYHAQRKRDCPYFKGEIGRCNCDNEDW